MNMPDTESTRPGDRSGSPPGDPSDQRLQQRARELYREAGRRVDPATAGRLRAARRQALETAGKPSRQVSRWLIPSGAVAVIALASLMLWQPLPQGGSRPAAAVDTATDLDNELPPDADKTDPVLYQNLDFYTWLASADHHPTTR
jgi:hypothetical protein